MTRSKVERRNRPRERRLWRAPFWRRRIAITLSNFKARLARLLVRATVADDSIENLKDARWQLTESEARFRELLDSQTEFIVRRDSDGRIVFANAAFCGAFGIALDDVRGMAFWPPSAQSLQTPDDNTGAIRRIESLQTVSGLRWFEWETHLVAAADAASDRQFVGRDVTEALHVEAQLRDARDQADAANRAKSRFLAAMSHEIRTPMNGILGMASLLHETVQSDEQKSYTRAIDLSAKSLLALIDEILDFSKIEAGKLQLTLAPFSLRQCIASAIELMQPNAAQRGNTISLAISDDVPASMVGDVMRVRQIILNLVSNAVKFTAHGAISVSVCRNTKTQFKIVVMDTGVGLSVDAMRVLFREFEQSDGAPAGRQNGTGLGLAISRRLARAMDGDITADGAPGQGATFTATFELAEHASIATHTNDIVAAPNAAARDATRHAGAPRVLLAEDNEVNALLARRVCERAGCSVVTVKDGRAAFEVAEEAAAGAGQAFDLILMDVFMPHLDGLEATRLIKASLGETPPIVALTANAFAEDRERCLAAGMDDYLAKPFDVQQLRAVLLRWLPHGDARRAG